MEYYLVPSEITSKYIGLLRLIAAATIIKSTKEYLRLPTPADAKTIFKLHNHLHKIKGNMRFAGLYAHILEKLSCSMIG